MATSEKGKQPPAVKPGDIVFAESEWAVSGTDELPTAEDLAAFEKYVILQGPDGLLAVPMSPNDRDITSERAVRLSAYSPEWMHPTLRDAVEAEATDYEERGRFYLAMAKRLRELAKDL